MHSDGSAGYRGARPASEVLCVSYYVFFTKSIDIIRGVNVNKEEQSNMIRVPKENVNLVSHAEVHAAQNDIYSLRLKTPAIMA